MQHLMSGSRHFAKKADLPREVPRDPALIFKGYQRLASRIMKGDMAKLSELRDQTGKPITQLLHEAVATYYRVLMERE